MLRGVEVSLFIGPAVPIPAPRAAMDALTRITVTQSAAPRTPGGFELEFQLDNRSPLHTLFLLTGGSQLPIFRVVVMVTVNGTPDVLIDGVVTKQSVKPGAGTGHSLMTVTGVDLTAVLGLIDFSGIPYPGMADEIQVLLILAKYAFLGIVPVVLPTILPTVESPTTHYDTQWGNDLDYIEQKAEETGYVFHLTAGPVPGVSTAYWGPVVKVGVPQPALNLDMDAYSNVKTLSFDFDAERKVQPIVFIQNKETKLPIPIPIPDITPLKPPLGLVPPLARKIQKVPGTGGLSPVRAALLGLAKAARSDDAVKATGTIDVTRYGRVLQVRKLVGVRGAGAAFDGLYFVEKVAHTISRGSYEQSFTLTRNGLVSTVPMVVA
ncbi:MAG: hypothetical protein ACR2MO_14305 [Acidimicrobiales bacterium]